MLNYICIAGSRFHDDSELHLWNAVSLEGNWRVVDTVCGAGKYDDKLQQWSPNICENFFLTDPEEFIYSHFPHQPSDPQYFQWQLLLPPITLDQFTQSPHLSSQFFHNGLELETDMSTPTIVEDKINIRMSGWEVMRFKHKLYPKSSEESDEFNQYCFCQLEEDDRTTVSFQVCPPRVGEYIIRIYGTPEANFSLGQPVNMEFLASFLLKCTRVYPKVFVYPQSDVPWGFTGDFYKLGLNMVIDDPAKWNGPKLSLKVGAKACFKFVHLQWPILSSVTLFDNQNNQLIQQQSTTYFLNSSIDKAHLKNEIDNGVRLRLDIYRFI